MPWARILDSLDQCLLETPLTRVDKLREVLNEFDKLWGPHIKLDEENFTSEKLQAVVGMKEQLNLVAKLGEHGIKNSGPGPFSLPFLIYNLEGREQRVLYEANSLDGQKSSYPGNLEKSVETDESVLSIVIQIHTCQS